jgi:3-dehydroquinate synthase
MASLYESRLPFYRMADVMVETDGLSVDQAAARVAAAIAPRLRNDPRADGHAASARAGHAPPGAEAGKAHRRITVRVDLAERSYDCMVGSGVVADAGRTIAALEPTRVFLVTNTTVGPLYAEAVRAAVAAADAGLGRGLVTIELDDGERFKTMASVERIYDCALDAGIDRRAVVVALGGGVVGDLTAFAASTILRGVRFVMIPTTLLAQVDSSVGGKTGMDRPQGKNLVGTFWQPSAVLIDPDTLETLPPRELCAGLAEVVKTGVIADAALFARLERDADALLARDGAVLTEVIARCVRLKADVVERDERETSGLRRILNFGHTVAHAVEQVTGYDRFLHGEAVAIGMGVAARLSERRGICKSADARRIEALLTRLGLCHEVPPGLDQEALSRAIALDKKAERSKVAYIFCEAIGRCRVETLEVAEIAASM